MARSAWLVSGACAALLCPAAALAQDQPAEPQVARTPAEARGVAVALVGAPTEDAIARCEAVARASYARDELTPLIAEDVAAALCGREVDPGNSSAARSMRDLRATFQAPFDGVAQQALLTALTKEVNVRGIVLVEPTATATTLSLLHRVSSPTGEPMALAVDPMRFELPTPAGDVEDERAFDPVSQAMRELLSAPPCERSAERTPLRSCPGAAPISTGAPGFAWWTYEAPKEGGASLVDSPWFWIAAGGVGALGLTVLIVSQTTDVNVGTVHIDGSVPE